MKKLTLLLAIMVFTASASAAKAPDPLVLQWQAKLQRLAQSPILGSYALGMRMRAEETLEHLRNAGDSQRAYWQYMTDQRVALAYAEARLAAARNQFFKLQQERNVILLQATRKHANAVRLELARERLQNAVANEQTHRLQAQSQNYAQQAQQSQQIAQQAQQAAQQAGQLAAAQEHAAKLARREARLAIAAVRAMRAQLDHLAASQGAQGMQMTLGDYAFASGQAALRPQARSHLGKLIQFVKSAPSKPILIIGYTDSRGQPSSNLALSRARARAVAQALIKAGIKAGRIHATGRGEADPVASNLSAAGRAKNRRVVVILKNG